MALPPPILLTYRPNQFVNAQPTITMAMELFGKYHPSALQQEMYNSLLEQTRDDANADQVRRDALRNELESRAKAQQNFRSAGLGPTGKAAIEAAGRAGRGGGGGRGTSGDVMDLAADLARTEVNRNSQAMKHGYEKLVQMETYFSPTQRHKSFLEGMRVALMGELPAAPTIDQVQDAIIRLSNARATNIDQVAATDSQRKAAALEMYTMLSIPKGTRPLMGPRLAQLIDELFETPGYLQGSIAEGGRTPAQVLEDEKDRFAVLLGKGLSPDEAERAGRAMLGKMDTDGDGVATEQEARAYMKAAGISAPLSEEEEFFLDRYVDKLKDDGRATVDEFDSVEDYEKSLAAYRKGKRAPTIGRGMERYYDQTYLDNLQRMQEIRTELEGLGDPISPTREAARRTLGLPRISAEDYAAAARVSPLAAESLPQTVQRFQQAQGDVSPRDKVERQAQKLIEADRGARNFPLFAQQISKLHPDDPVARRRAFAYYGAHFMQLDTRNRTLNPAVLEGNVDAMAQQMAATQPPKELFFEEAAFDMQDVQPTPQQLVQQQLANRAYAGAPMPSVNFARPSPAVPGTPANLAYNPLPALNPLPVANVGALPTVMSDAQLRSGLLPTQGGLYPMAFPPPALPSSPVRPVADQFLDDVQFENVPMILQ